ncbi:T-cell surface antigen CD2 [Xenopus laevis]|uniref:Ig-like domain-containing protein n=2 Tax=Xenopus laevis TaxID=8355 RepID=A0A974DI85_XENLA|nr:T-cell surface antigen CD2 [Xenopus laevis]OCT91436.1 hypothetical protein XELAEV_18014490mg [Xenopus laevis]
MDRQSTHIFQLCMGFWILMFSGWAAGNDPEYVALSNSVLINIPSYSNAENDQVTWKDGNGTLMERFRKSSSYYQTKGYECELFRKGSLYLKQLGKVGDETYRVEVYNQNGKQITDTTILVTVIERVRSPILNYTCAGKQINLSCDVPEGPTTTSMKISWNNKERKRLLSVLRGNLMFKNASFQLLLHSMILKCWTGLQQTSQTTTRDQRSNHMGPKSQTAHQLSQRAAHSKQRGAKFPDQASQKQQTPSQPQRPPVPANHPCDQLPYPQPP